MLHKEYKNLVKEKIKSKNKIKNACCAFVFGGLVALVGQCIFDVYNLFDMKDSTNITLTLITIIFIASLFTGLGLFDKFASVAGAGSFIPITGFSNALTSSSIEGRSEGPIYGIGSNMFKLAGSVLVYGIIAAFVTNLIRYILVFIGG